MEADKSATPLRVLVQNVLRPDRDSRLYAGIVAGGTLRQGDPVQVALSGVSGNISRIIVAGEETATRPSPASRSPSGSTAISTLPAATRWSRRTIGRKSPISSRRI